tara:strand:+ start:277 stop:504 length:228 start_codon:yes stop_codon:yes gene_type:complete
MLKKISDKDIYKKKLNKNFKIKSNSSIIIDANKEMKLKKFLNNEFGWVYAQLDNIYLDGWYFSNKNNSIGGDHAF